MASSNGRTTMKDVAEAAGVSLQTVSNYVNGRLDQMAEPTRQRVEDAMQALAYHPNVSARGLRSARTRTLGFLVLDEHSSFLADPLTDLIMAGIGDVARARRFGILIQAAEPGSETTELLAPIFERRVDGAVVVLSGAPEVRLRHIERLGELGTPFVIFDETLDDTAVLSVRAADRDGSRRLTEYLISKGHRRIAFLAARVPWAVVEQRHLGYQDALRSAGIRRSPSLELFEAGWEPAGGAAMVEKLFSRARPPTAVMCGSDLLAVAAVHELRKRGLRVPEDVAVTGFDDFAFSAFVNPPLTTVAVPAYAMGRQAAEMLIDELEGRDPLVRQVVFSVDLRLRESA